MGEWLDMKRGPQLYDDKPKAPCRGCEEREIGCHSTCKAYTDFRAELDEHNARVRKILDEKKMMMDIREHQSTMSKAQRIARKRRPYMNKER